MTDKATPSRRDSKHQEKVLTLMRQRLKTAIEATGESRQNELDDLKFFAGSPDNQWQWPNDVLSTRSSATGALVTARPCLTINKLPQHVRQVTNDQRQNRPRGKVIPADDRADADVAEVFNGMIRHIEYMSDADVAYDTACENQVTFGEGYIRILTDYSDGDTFNQDIRIARVRNSFSVHMDPLIQDPCGADAQWCFITEEIPRVEYEALYPNASSVSTLNSLGVGDAALATWLSESTVRIAEYFHIEIERKTLNLYHGDQTAIEGTENDQYLRGMYGKPLRSRSAEQKQVKWCKTNGYEILEESDWAGQYIPVVRVVGNEFEVEGRLYVSGLVRNAKDAQRMYNYWNSQEAEMLALAPKAPFVGYGGQFEGYEGQWKTANTQNWPYLEVNPDVTDGAGNMLPLPQRSQPPMASSGLLQAKLGASEDIKATTGQFDASLGMGGNERSGRAILARQKEGDTGTFHYVDNLARAVRYITRQIVGLIPKIYDTARVTRIVGEDSEPSSVKLDPSQEMPLKKIVDEQGTVIEKIYNLGVGKYDVVVMTGPGYATKRVEAAESMATLLQGNPELWQVAGDLFVKNMDWPGAAEMAERLKRSIDPKLLSTEDDPALQAAQQQIEQMGQQLESMHQMLQNTHKSMEAQTIAIDQFKADVQSYDAETKRMSALSTSMQPEQIQQLILQTMKDIQEQPHEQRAANLDIQGQPAPGVAGLPDAA